MAWTGGLVGDLFKWMANKSDENQAVIDDTKLNKARSAAQNRRLELDYATKEAVINDRRNKIITEQRAYEKGHSIPEKPGVEYGYPFNTGVFSPGYLSRLVPQGYIDDSPHAEMAPMLTPASGENYSPGMLQNMGRDAQTLDRGIRRKNSGGGSPQATGEGQSDMATGAFNTPQFQASRPSGMQANVMQGQQAPHKGSVMGTLTGLGLGLGTGNWAPLASTILGSAAGGAVNQAIGGSGGAEGAPAEGGGGDASAAPKAETPKTSESSTSATPTMPAQGGGQDPSQTPNLLQVVQMLASFGMLGNQMEMQGIGAPGAQQPPPQTQV